MENKDNKKFEYTYAAPTLEERREIRKIRDAYTPKHETDFERLIALDKKIKIPPQIVALTLGIVGTLVFGLGLALILEWNTFILGAAIAAVGILPLAFAYPVWKHMFLSRKKKYAPQLLELSEKLLGEQKNKEHNEK